MPWPVWLSWLGIVLQGERLLVQFPVRAHAWVAGLLHSQGIDERQAIDVFLPLFLSLAPSKINKYYMHSNIENILDCIIINKDVLNIATY